jgi:signal transduction histidine kinase
VVIQRRLLGETTTTLDVVIAIAAAIVAVLFANRGYLSAVDQVNALPRQIPAVLRGVPVPLPPAAVSRHLLTLPSLTTAGVALTALPLAFRRTYPVGAFCVIMAAVVATNQYSTAVTIVIALFSAYCAVVYSTKQWAAFGCLLTGLLIVTFAYPKASPQIPAIFTPALLLLPTVALGYLMRMWQRRARQSASRLERAEAEHEAATARAVALERARIASELHDVVTHNVSVMVVQAGAARQVLGRSPADAREAMLAIESSGRNAMTELRHLLSLLAPDRTGEDTTLRPQPGLDEVPGLVAGVRGAGLAVELTVTGTPAPLPPGLGLAAYRVVQEALTNVIKHAGGARTVVLISWTAELEITVSDDGSGRGYGGEAGSGRGLIGLRERVAIYGGSLDAGPRPGGGWRIRARFPLEPVRLPAQLQVSA